MYKKINNTYKYETYKEPLLNIYNEPLVECGNRNMGSGSWDRNFMCSERGGGEYIKYV